jgi:hypothetical protein
MPPLSPILATEDQAAAAALDEGKGSLLGRSFSTAKTQQNPCSRTGRAAAVYHAVESKLDRLWLPSFGKLGFGRKAATLRIRMGSFAASFRLSFSSS